MTPDKRRPRGRTGPGRPVRARPSARRVPRAGSGCRPRRDGRGDGAERAPLAAHRPGRGPGAGARRADRVLRSSLRAYLEQRGHINDLKTQIAEHEANIDALESEKERWEDPAYVAKQARERLGYVMPGEKTYLVLGEDGKPLEPASQLQDPNTVISTTQTPWWSDGWASVELAGNPPKTGRPPASEIDGTKKGTGGEGSAGETPEAP